MEYYGNELNNIEKQFYLGLLDALQNRRSSVKANQITDETSFLKCISAVNYDFPHLFYVDFSRYRYIAYNDGWEYRPTYLYNENETLIKQRKIEEVVQKIKLEISRRRLTSVYQKCGFIHAYLVRNCIYDDAAVIEPDKRFAAYTAEGPLIDKTGVCLGIALAYRLLCSRFDIDAIVAKGVSLKPNTTTYEGHAWNIIRVGGSAAQIDVTWDMCLSSSDCPIRYDYFFLPDIEMMRDHQYVGYPICRKMNLSYHEKNLSQFRELREIDAYVEKVFRSCPNWDQPGVYYFQFKMTNRKDSVEDVQQYVRKLLRKSTNKGYSYTVSINSPQSVFVYKLEIMK